MDMNKLIERINFLYKKSKNEGLTPEEKDEQQKLRQQYIGVIKTNFRAQLDSIKIVPDEEETLS